MPLVYKLLRASRAVVFLLTSGFSILGCSASFAPAPVPLAAIAVGGNWQIASSDAVAAKLPLLSGELTGSSSSITGMLHSHATGDCVAPAVTIAITGSANASNRVTLTGADLAGGTLSITGTLAPDGKSLSDAAYTVTGGSCAFAAQAHAVANAYSSITGTYTGGFSDANGQVVNIVATLTQTPSSDPNGNFQLSGTATFPNNPCFNSPVSIANSQVTGGSFNLTYSDSLTMNSVNAGGTFSTDGRTLTATNWTLSGPCGPDSGTGALSR